MKNTIIIFDIFNDAQKIIDWYKSESYKYTNHKDTKVDSVDILKKLYKFYEDSIIGNCIKLDCKWATAMCYYIISKASYDHYLATSKLHLICKSAVYYMFRYGKHMFNVGKKDIEIVKNILSDMGNLLTLDSIDALGDFFPDRKMVRLLNNQIIFTKNQHIFINKYNITMAGRGTRQRFSAQSLEFFLKRRQEFIRSIKKIIAKNKKVCEIELFKNSIYQYLPDYSEETKLFWDGLLNRVKFIDKLFEKIFITMVERHLQQNICCEMLFSFEIGEIDDIKDCILCKDNFDVNKYMTFLPPFVHVAPGYYATSFNLFGDSINAYIERSIYYNFDSHGQRVIWADKVCKSLSKEFENKVIDAFSENGFIVGEVTNKGAWKANNLVLFSSSSEKIPGQIDALAIKGYKIYIVECKVYNDINNVNRIKTLNNLFDITYRNNIITPLIEKVDFIKDSNIYNYVKCANKDMIDITPIIVTDIPMPVFFSKDSEILKNIIVTDFPSLVSLLSSESYKI